MLLRLFLTATTWQLLFTNLLCRAERQRVVHAPGDQQGGDQHQGSLQELE